MTPKKLFLMFLPLLLALTALAFIIQDLKHPQLRSDDCDLVGRGESIQAFKTQAKVLYRKSERPEDDIGFTCKALGNVVINDDVPLPLKPTQTVKIVEHRYQILPKRYTLSVGVVNPQEARLNEPPGQEPSQP